MRINKQAVGNEPIAALDAVRTECLEETAVGLLYAVRQSEISWRHEWAQWKELHLMKPNRVQRHCAQGSEVQEQVREVLVELDGIDQRLARLCDQLPQPGEEFVAAAEVRGLLDCVRTDLLADAMATLEKATCEEAGLRLVFARRQHDLRGGA